MEHARRQIESPLNDESAAAEQPKIPTAVDEDPEARSTSPFVRAEFDALLEKLRLGVGLHGASREMERFWELARSTGVIDEGIAELEALVAADPADLEARMDLAEYYIAKLYSVPGGPEQGLWNDKVEQQWQEVLARDPDHWDAQFRLGTNWSYYPDFLSKTNDAIRALARARELQEREPPREEFVETYLSLARMYMRKAKVEEARAVLSAGLRRHPGDVRLVAALEDLE